ncbi:MAG TPA: SDR family NAD(P)-dependent oxidoreductase, partial [Lacipirellulaceae bacterium]|nr:SDR family NAD(P)-dependent oxidoreductase [Lacipirellulaceae bacterium]
VENAADLLPAQVTIERLNETPIATNAEPTQPTLSVEACIEGLVKLVADRTGYPTDMLDPDARLEADLGIDSIKRVEIIAAFRREILQDSENLPANSIERLTAAPTIRAIAECAAELVSPNNDSSGTTIAGSDSHGTQISEAKGLPHADELMVSLAQVVADRTGYPLEMLDADAKLEADLGIDSIKRVEIIAAFQRHALIEAQLPPAGFVEQLTSAKTMRELVALVTAALSTTAPRPTVLATVAIAQHNSKGIGDARANSTPADSEKPTTVEVCPRCKAISVDAPFSSESVELADGVIIITEDNRGVAARVADELSAIGRATIRISEEGLKSKADICEAVDAARRQHGRIAAVIHLAPLSKAPIFPGANPSEWKERQDLELKGLLYLLQSLALELAADKSVAVSAFTIGGGDFDLNASKVEASHPWRGGIAGLLKVADREYPKHVFHVIDMEDEPSPALVLRELLVKGAVEIGYRQGKRLTLVAQSGNEPATDAKSELPISSKSVVLVTGGGRGITAQIVQEIAGHVPATFVLVGRSALPSEEESQDTSGLESDAEIRLAIIKAKKALGEDPIIAAVERELGQLKNIRGIRNTLAGLEAAGARAEYVSCDIRDPAAVESLIADVRWRYGQIDAFIHGAGILRDQMIKDKTSDAFDDVMSTKVDSLLYFLQAIEPDKLALVVMFSSVSGFFGNTGQCDYAAANEILNRCARRLQSSTLAKVVALNWGPWADVGMVTAEVAKKMRSNGVQLIAPAAGRAAAWQEIISDKSGSVRSILGFGPWIDSNGNLKAAAEVHLGAAPPPLLADQDVKRNFDGSVTAKIQLSTSRQPFLRDHCIDGKPVLPLAMAVELMAEIASVAQPGWHVVEVADIRMLSGIVLETHAKEIIARAEAVEQYESESGWRVQILDAEGKRRLYEAVVRLSRTPPSRPALPVIPVIERPYLLTATEAYERCLFHGPAFQVITEISRVDETGIDAIAIPSDATRCMGRHVGPWLIDGVILDAAAQLALLWSEIIHDVVMLPTRAVRYHAFGDLGMGPVELRLRNRQSADRNAYKVDIWITRGKELLGHVEGLEGAGSAQLNRIMAGNSQ